MLLTERHARLLAEAFGMVLGKAPNKGDIAFARCLTPDVVASLADDDRAFAPGGWQVRRVADLPDSKTRTITADRAVELRESRGPAMLLLIDTALAGAGMDGIYSAAREVSEATLFTHVLRLANMEAVRGFSPDVRRQTERATDKARKLGRRFGVSPWIEFDFLVRAANRQQPGALLYLLGLWPVKQDDDIDLSASLDISRLFVDRLLSPAVAGMTPSQRIRTLKLLKPTALQISDLERFLQSAATRPLLSALADLAEKPHLWVNELKLEGAAQEIQSIELTSWRTKAGRIVVWSGLTAGPDDDAPPVFVLKSDAANSGDYSKLEVRWKSRPDNLAKGAVDYQVAIVTDMDEELAAQRISHSGQQVEKCRFTNDDFSLLSDDALVSAKIVLSVIGNDQVQPQESEEFVIRFGEPPEHVPAGVGKKARTFSEGVIELESRAAVSALISVAESLPEDNKGYMLLRAAQSGKSFRVFRPPLIREVEKQWAVQSGAIGCWQVRVHASGTRASAAEFVRFSGVGSVARPSLQALWDRTTGVSRRMAERFAAGSGVGQIYDDKAKGFEAVVKEYLLAWAALLEEGDPSLALANTVEVQTLSGKTIGLIVLPSHPLRVAWHVAYDNLVLHAAFEQGAKPKQIRDEFLMLDGAMFPPFLPGTEGGHTFVFADTLGFHAAAMVPDYDKEPKAAVAILARVLGESATADTAPTVGKQSAHILGNEITKYLDCHPTSRLLHVHALRPGDGLTIARALGRVQEQRSPSALTDDDEEGEQQNGPAFVLELYPSSEQRGVAGRFIAEAREKRRRGAGVLSPEDRWMLQSISLPGGINLPKLRWARKSEEEPSSAAHVAVAFDTFESRVAPDEPARLSRPLYVYGLLSFFERVFTNAPSPLWRSSVPASAEGEKHPSDRAHSDRLLRLQRAVEQCVARSIAADNRTPTLRTEISPEKAHSLHELHRLSDWVITLDRNGGVEYFDSPRDNREIYEVYVIDTVPERDDLGCLQLITSTSNLAEVRNLLDEALDQMGLSRSRRNAEFLLEHLKALSGRLAIRLTGQRAPTSELIALALSHANCRQTQEGDNCWMPLEAGFLIPVDDVRDLIPPLMASESREEEAGNSASNARPDLIYVSVVPRKGLLFQFIEIKYRRHLRATRSPDVLEGIRQQVESLRRRWDEWYSSEETAASFQVVRRAKLARVLRFYADKAHRHYLTKDRYETIIAEIDRMVEKGQGYSFATGDRVDRGWVFCAEYVGTTPLEISPIGWNTRIFLFGPGLLPDSSVSRGEPISIVGPVSEDGITRAKVDEGKSSSSPSAGSQQSAVSSSPTSQSTPIRTGRETPSSESGPGEETASGKVSTANDMTDRDATEGSVVLGMDWLTGVEVRWPLTVKGNPHLLVAGLPGMGKTTCLLNLCKQMLDADVRPIIFSYHQDFDERLQPLVDAVRYLDFDGLGFNPLQVTNRQSPKAYLDMAGALRDIFVAIYPELGDVQGERIRKAIKESFVERGWSDPHADPTTLVEPEFGRFVEILRAEPKPDAGLRTLLARLEELDDYGFFEPAESYESLWESAQPIIIRIHTTLSDNLQKAFASLVFYGLYKDMFRRGTRQRITHAVVFDEAHRAARLRLIPTMAKECRKFGISLVLASQEARDFNVSLFSAIANYLVLRLNETDAKALVRNVASSDQERALVDKIKQMERFKAFYFSEGRRKPAPVALLP